MPDFSTVAARATDALWFLREDNFEPALEHELESRFSFGNGFIGIRGSLDMPVEASRPRTYVAGLYALRPGPPPLSVLVPAPHAYPLRLLVDGEELDIGQGSVRQHTRLLDYRSGVLRSFWEQEMASGRVVSLESLRFVSLAVPALAVQLLTLRLDAPARVGLQVMELETPLLQREGASVWRTVSGPRILACYHQARLCGDSARPSGWSDLHSLPATVDCERELSILQLAGYGLAEDREAASTQAGRAHKAATRAGLPGLYDRHVKLWQERWQDSDMVVEGDEEAQRALRFAVYHLNSAADAGNANVSVAARGLTGDGYLGHVFWDTEVFMLPFYTFSRPEAARTLLEYRYRTLPAAREKARRLGFRGALYAWESTDTGEEATPPYAMGPRGEVIAIRNGDLEQHVSAAVAYGVLQYWQATQDTAFLLRYGAEMLMETARFWASRARLEADGLHHIRNVIGPDEYHEAVDDNAYTNTMARWNIERGLDVAALLQERWPERWRELAARLDLTDEELEEWRSVGAAMFLPQSQSGLIEQFAGYFGLEDIDLAAYTERTAPIDVLLGPERTRRSQVIKQADVLMLMALLPDDFSDEVQQQNFDYYEPRCGHGSSLSPPIHSLVAARLGKTETAERYFRETGAIDLDDSMGNSAAGIHMAALGGLWQAAIFGFAGLSLRDDGLAFRPRLPRAWSRLRFPLRWRGRRVTVEISRERRLLEVSLQHGRPLKIYAGESLYRLEKGRPVLATLPGEVWG